MGHSNVRAKVRRRKVATLAAYSRQFTVSNTAKSISKVVEHKREIVYNNPIVNPLTGNKFDQVNPHPIPGRFGITVTGYDWIKPIGLLWKKERHKQPKRMTKCKMRKYSNWKSYTPQSEEVKKVKRKKHNDFLKYFLNYPYTIKPMSKEAYMEKLVQHKLEKWEKKNPKPVQDLFDKVEDWEQCRFVAEQRFRDFVISVYYKMKVFATVAKPGGPPFKEIPIGEVTGGKNAIEEATKIAKEAKAKNINILHCQVYEPNGKYRLVA